MHETLSGKPASLPAWTATHIHTHARAPHLGSIVKRPHPVAVVGNLLQQRVASLPQRGRLPRSLSGCIQLPGSSRPA